MAKGETTRFEIRLMKQLYLMKKLLLTLALVSGAMGLSAQRTPVTKPDYVMAERFSPDNVNKMVFSTAVNPHYLKSGNKFWYSYDTPDGRFYYIVDAASATRRPLFDRDRMASQVTLITKDPFDAKHLPIDSIRFAPDEKSFTFQVTTSLKEDYTDKKGKKAKRNKVVYMNCDIASGNVTELNASPNPVKYPRWVSVSPDGEKIVFARRYDLWWMDRENFEKALKNDKDSTIVEHRITDDGEEFYPWGGSTDNNTEKSRAEKLDQRLPAYIVWSPDSRHFAVTRADQRKVESLWVINSIDQPRPTLQSYKYHMAGEKEAPQYQAFLFDTADWTHRHIDTYAFKDQTFSIHRRPIDKSEYDNSDRIPSIWLGDNDYFLLTRTSRDLKRIDICRVDIDADSLKARALVEERLNKSLETRTPRLLKSGEFVLWSERDGWGHLYLYAPDGKLVRRLTEGPFHCEGITGVDEASRTLFFTACGKEQSEHPYYMHLYRIGLDGTGLRRLDKDNFNHTGDLADNCRYFVDNYSRVDTAPVSALYDANGKLLMTLEETDLHLLFEAGYKFPEIFTAKAADGITDLYGVIYKPFDFDSTKLYPIIEYVYPGPQTEAVNYSFSKSMNRTERLAQLGFIVVTVGNRGGHPNRSKWYHTYGYGNLRDYGLADKKYVAEQLAVRRPYMDISRVGIHGHSGGGFMSTAAILTYPDFFKAAVSCAGNHENNIYNRWWSEKHHGVEEVISEKGDTTFNYDIAKNTQLAGNLKGHLMLVTGDIDDNVHPANTYRMVDALIKNNKRFDMLVLPGDRHSFTTKGEYFFWRMADYFSEHLLGDSEKTTDIPQLK